MTSIHPSRLLTFALRVDAVVSAGFAVLQLLSAGWLAEALRLPQSLLVESGLFLIAYANLLFWLASRSRLGEGWVAAVVLGNVAWACACVALALGAGVTPRALGTGFLGLHAAAVLALAAFEWKGLRLSPRADPAGAMARSPS